MFFEGAILAMRCRTAGATRGSYPARDGSPNQVFHVRERPSRPCKCTSGMLRRMTAMGRLRDTFTTVVAAGDRCDLGRAALEIARLEHPDLDPLPWLARLDGMADAIRSRAPTTGDAQDAFGHVTRYLFDECGFRGNTDDYYDPRNSCLNDVLERRVGIPITLSVLVLEIGVRLGLAV